MTLRSKTLASVGLVLLACAALTFAVAYFAATGRVSRTASESASRIRAEAVDGTRKALEALESQLRADEAALSASVLGLSHRDDTYAYVESRSPAWRRANLPDSLPEALGLSVLLIVSAGGRIVDRMSYDLERHAFRDLPAGLIASLAPGEPLPRGVEGSGALSGILLLPQGPMLVAAARILPGSSQAESRGIFLVGRFLSPERLGERARATVELFVPGPAELPEDVRSARDGGELSSVRELGDGMMAGYAVWTELTGSAKVVARVTPPAGAAALAMGALAEIERQAWIGSAWILAALVGSVLVVLGTVLLQQDTAIFRRTGDLTDRLGEIAASPVPPQRVLARGDDELSLLEHSVNEAIAALESGTRSSSERAQSEHAAASRFRLALQSLGQVAFELDIPGGRISLDGAVAGLTGHSPQELATVPRSAWEAMIHPEDRAAAVAAGEQAAESGAAYRVGYRLKRKDGSYVEVEERGARAPGAAARVTGILLDASARETTGAAQG